MSKRSSRIRKILIVKGDFEIFWIVEKEGTFLRTYVVYDEWQITSKSISD